MCISIVVVDDTVAGVIAALHGYRALTKNK